MFIHIIGLLIFAYLFSRSIYPLRLGVAAKAGLTLLLLLATQQHLLSRLLWGGLSAPEVPPAQLILQGWLFVSVLFFLLLNLFRDVSAAALWLLKKRSKRASGFSPERRQALFALAAAVPAAYGVRQAMLVPEARTYRPAIAGLPRGLEGISMVQISDLHVSPLLQRAWVEGVVERVNALRPDLILLTGDMVDGLPARRADSIAPLRELRAKYGVFGCAGNHEYYSDFAGWMRVFDRLGITMLLNSHQALAVNGATLVLAGVTDIAANRFGLPEPDAAAALRGAPDDAFRLMLDHRPGNAAANARHGAHMQLSGHTHGGHMLGMDVLVGRFNNGYVYGWYTVDNMRMYVSSGAGLWNGFPVRLGVPSEIARFVLSKA